MRDAFAQRLKILAEKDPRIILLTGDLGFGVFDEFKKALPDRYLNCGVAEQNMLGVATGLAMEGKIVFVYSIANFPTLRCLEQIRNDAAYHNANVKVVSVGGGFGYGALGISHHSTEDISILRAIPRSTVIAPGDDWEAEEATSAIVETAGFCYLKLDKNSAGRMEREGESFEIGKGRILREGSDLALISGGGTLATILKAADELAKDGISCRVVSLHTIKPIDEEILRQAASQTGGIITVEEHTVEGGLGGAVAEICLEKNYLPRKFFRMGLRNEFSKIVGSPDYLRKIYGLDKDAVVSKAKQLLNK